MSREVIHLYNPTHCFEAIGPEYQTESEASDSESEEDTEEEDIEEEKDIKE